MTNLTIAKSLKIATNSAAEKMVLADELAISADQNWKKETTVFLPLLLLIYMHYYITLFY